MRLNKIAFLLLSTFLVYSCLNKKNKVVVVEKGKLEDFNFMEMMQSVSKESKLEHKDWFTWGASVLKGDDGKYHMIYCRWPKKYPFSNGWLMDAELCYAKAEKPEGPFTHEKTVLQGRKSEGLFHA